MDITGLDALSPDAQGVPPPLWQDLPQAAQAPLLAPTPAVQKPASGGIPSDVVDELRSGGMSENGIRGVLANIKDESGFNPGLRHPDQPNWGGEAHYAHGLYQEGGDEWNHYAGWLNQNYPGADWQDHRLQTRFLAQNLKQNYPQVWDSMNNGTPEQAAQSFVAGYLKPRSDYLSERVNRYGQGVPEIEAYNSIQPKQSTGEGSGLLQALSSPFRRAFHMDDTSSGYSNGPVASNGYNNGPSSYPFDNRELAKALISNAFSESKSPGVGTAIGKMAQLITGMGMNNDYQSQMRDYYAHDPLLGNGGGQPAQQPQQPQSLVQRLAGVLMPSTQPQQVRPNQQAQPTQPVAAPRPATAPAAPVANPFFNAAINPTASATEAGGVTPVQFKPQAEPASMAAPNTYQGGQAENTAPSSDQGQPRATQGGKFFMPPSIPMDQARQAIEAEYAPQVQLLQSQARMTPPGSTGWDQAHKEYNQLLAQKQAKIAALSMPQPRDFQLNDGTVVHTMGTPPIGWTETAEPRLDPAKIKAHETGLVEHTKTEQKELDKDAANIETAGNDAPNHMGELKLAQDMMNDPAFYSGAGADMVHKVDSYAKALGLSEGRTSNLQDAFKKVVSATSLNSIKDLASGGGVGQIRVAEMNLIGQANANLGNNKEANQVILSANMRAMQWARDLQQFKQQYEADHGGQLDHGWLAAKGDWMSKNPILGDSDAAALKGLLTGKSGKGGAEAAEGGTSKNPAPEGYVHSTPDGPMIKQGGKWVPYDANAQSAKTEPQSAPNTTPAPSAPAPSQQQASAAPATPAPPPSKYQEGQTATGPNGEKIVFSNGQWVAK